jgi:hypothetical protein
MDPTRVDYTLYENMTYHTDFTVQVVTPNIDGLQVMQDRRSEGEPSSNGYRSFSGR